MKKFLLFIFALFISFWAHAQYEDSIVIELLYLDGEKESDYTVLIDRATIYKFGEIILADAPIAQLPSFQYEFEDSFGTPTRKGQFTFNEDPVLNCNGKIPAKVFFEGSEYKAFLRFETPKKFRFNFYTDTIKPVLNFWINVEIQGPNGTYFPMSPEDILLSTDYGEIHGLELVLPENPDVEEVTIKACLISDQLSCITTTLPIMKKDANGIYEDEEGYDPKSLSDDPADRKESQKDYLKVSAEDLDFDDLEDEEEVSDDENLEVEDNDAELEEEEDSDEDVEDNSYYPETILGRVIQILRKKD